MKKTRTVKDRVLGREQTKEGEELAKKVQTLRPGQVGQKLDWNLTASKTVRLLTPGNFSPDICHQHGHSRRCRVRLEVLEIILPESRPLPPWLLCPRTGSISKFYPQVRKKKPKTYSSNLSTFPVSQQGTLPKTSLPTRGSKLCYSTWDFPDQQLQH